MNFDSISFIFNRALSLTLMKKKNLIIFCILALSGLLVVFFRGLALHAGEWVRLSLTFLPIFLCGGILLSTGIYLIQIYQEEVNKRNVSYWDVMAKYWTVIIGASYFSMPIILSYLLLWMLLGVFVLLKDIPMMGDFFSVVLSFAPFLINLGTLILCVISLFLLFFVAPIIALKGIDRSAVFQGLVKRLERDPFSNFVLVIVALIPLSLVLILLTLAAFLTGSLCLDCPSSSQTILTWFFIMFPFTAFLTPAVIFFFNFAAEAYILMQKQLKI